MNSWVAWLDQTASGPEKARLKTICGCLIAMREFHLKEFPADKSFLGQWKRDKAHLPTADEYLEKIATASDFEVTTVKRLDKKKGY
ncbi:hypothetical protein IIA28_15705 [candidate division KSB1 bacterium]|nr:hypothetical protein [candidate division KSB1 bacterium]MCH8874483.1 hypothetical protein [candidate division KSB1 bacterium]MCH8956744.1 hypothetical protein [candidate division KSB1 bacterium]